MRRSGYKKQKTKIWILAEPFSRSIDNNHTGGDINLLKQLIDYKEQKINIWISIKLFRSRIDDNHTDGDNNMFKQLFKRTGNEYLNISETFSPPYRQ